MGMLGEITKLGTAELSKTAKGLLIGAGVVGGLGAIAGVGVGAYESLAATNRKNTVVDGENNRKDKLVNKQIDLADRAATASENHDLPAAYSITDTLRTVQNPEQNTALDATGGILTTTSNAWSQADGTRQAPTSYTAVTGINAQQKVDLHNTDQQAGVMNHGAELQAEVAKHGGDLQAGVDRAAIRSQEKVQLDGNAQMANTQNNIGAFQLAHDTNGNVSYNTADGTSNGVTVDPQTPPQGTASNGLSSASDSNPSPAQPGLDPTQVSPQQYLADTPYGIRNQLGRSQSLPRGWSPSTPSGASSEVPPQQLSPDSSTSIPYGSGIPMVPPVGA